VGAIVKVEPMTTARALRGPFDYLLPEALRGDVGVGSMLVVPFGRRQVLGVVVGMAERSEVAEERLLEPLRALELGVPMELVALAEWIAAEYCSTIARALTLVLPPGAARRLSGRRRRSAIRRTAHLPVGARGAGVPTLTVAQQEVLDGLLAAMRMPGERPEARLLHGVTGSGKTEIYLRATAAALEQERGAIVLVPEIALTPQIVGRFIERFGDTVAVMHSRLGAGERYEEWRRLRSGEARVCVGPRSAVFAPIERLGLIVLDEEHDASYKHEGDPRYDARAVAQWRARECGALLLLGSATPRPESHHELARLRLPRRADGRPLPAVSVLDMCGEPHRLHPQTAHALAQVRRDGRKAIVLLNRRGWSNFLSCRACGEVWSCPECDVALVVHRAEAVLACHHCGHRERLPERCGCGSATLARHGTGTERLQHELAAALDGDGGFPVFRLDADAVASADRAASGQTGGQVGGQAREVGGQASEVGGQASEVGGQARGVGGQASEAGRQASEAGDQVGNRWSDQAGAAATPGGVAAILRRFEAAPCGVLIGTQMVAKGHDFPDVALGVVLDADATLRFPDFRAEERTFALIAQLAGRVGRGGEGHVLVQTIAPHARSIEHAARHDSEGFLAGELQRRGALRYPPYAHLIRIVCSAADAARAQTAAQAMRTQLKGLQAEVLGPAALFRLRGRERRALIVKADERRAAVRAVGEAVRLAAADRAHAGVSFSVDVDPQ
jgi:primosomal protein N'